MSRKRARELAAKFIEAGDPIGWFEALYAEAQDDPAIVPWADLKPNPVLVEWAGKHSIVSKGARAIEIGSGYGDNAEFLAQLGFGVTAFDISPTAISVCRRRFPASKVDYRVADLFEPPPTWSGEFDFALEAYTLQVLPGGLRAAAMKNMARLLKPDGSLLVICRGRDESDPKGEMPWPLTRIELEEFVRLGLRIKEFQDFLDAESPPVRRFLAYYGR